MFAVDRCHHTKSQVAIAKSEITKTARLLHQKQLWRSPERS